MQEAGIYRNRLATEGNFTTVSNAWIRKSGLSPQANFLWIYLLSHKVGYELRDTQILNETGFGPKGLRSARNELVDAGWLHLSRKKNADGSLGTYAYHLKEPRVPQGTVEQSTVEEGTVPEGSDLRRPLEEKTISKKTIEERARTLPDDWAPKDDIYALAKYEVLDIEKEAESFMLFHTAKGTKYKNWDAAFRKWLNKGLDFHAEKHYKESERDLEKRRLDEWLASQMEDDSE